MTLLNKMLFNIAINQNELTKSTLAYLTAGLDLSDSRQLELHDLIVKAHQCVAQCRVFLVEAHKLSTERNETAV